MSHLTSTVLARVRANPYQTASLCVFLVAAYLCLVNLNYVALWHDEAPVAFLGHNLLEQGDIVGWDGRNPSRRIPGSESWNSISSSLSVRFTGRIATHCEQFQTICWNVLNGTILCT